MLPIRTLRCLLLTLLLGATMTAGAHQSSSYVQDLQDLLVALSASDFAAHGPRPDAFRDVDLRYRENDHGARSYMLCGQFRVSSGPDWIDFATIRTNPHEQWIGGSATDICARAVPVPVSTDGKDLSSALQSALGGNAPATSPP